MTRNRPQFVVRSLLCLAALALGHAQAAAQLNDPDVAVAAGREAIDQLIDYPWYDDDTDSVAAVDVSPPPDLSWMGDVLYWLAWGGLTLIVIGLVYVLVRVYLDREGRLVAAQRDQEEQPQYLSADRVEALPLKLDQNLTTGDLLAEAQRSYASGNYDRAIVYLYSFQLLELDNRQVIHLTRGKTNRQYLRETRRHSRLGDLLQQTMVVFEDVFFGGHALGRLRFEQCWSDLDSFQSQLREETAQ